MQQSLIVYAKNKERVSSFYQQTLGLAASEVEPTHDLLVGNGLEILIHAIPPHYAADIEIADPPQPREETPFKPVFFVADLAAASVAAFATGGFLQPPEKIWHYRGAQVLDGWDPEGNVIQLRQRVADRA